MPAHDESLDSDYNTIQLFDLVADIERYPEFLPWCAGARILSRSDNLVVAELLISFGIFTEKYTSKVTLNRPNKISDYGSIKAELVSGPFKYLNNEWKFYPKQEGRRATVEFHIDFCFRSAVLEKLIGTTFDQATAEMVSAFEQRAKQIYK